MNAWGSKICAVSLALALVPGVFEILENATHLVTEGHFAHALADGDRHEPAGPEHGCTPIFHFCGCHAGLFVVGTPAPPAIQLRTAGFHRRLDPDLRLTDFWPSIDRPPQV